MSGYFREFRYIWCMRGREPREPEWGDLLMDDVPIIVDEAAWFLYERLAVMERIRVSDCFSTTHNRGTVPGLLPPIPDGYVTYSVWIEWRRNGAGWSRLLFVVRVGALEDAGP